jgi:hypothetical protein
LSNIPTKNSSCSEKQNGNNNDKIENRRLSKSKSTVLISKHDTEMRVSNINLQNKSKYNDIKKSKKKRKDSFDNKLKIKLYCEENKSRIKELDSICISCIEFLQSSNHLEEWFKIKNIITTQRNKANAKFLLFGKDNSDVDCLFEKGLQVKGKNFEEGEKNMSMMKDGCNIF